MTTRQTFECDICHSPVADESKGRGFVFGPPDGIQWAVVSQAEHHLCGGCITSLIIALRAPGIREDYGRRR